MMIMIGSIECCVSEYLFCVSAKPSEHRARTFATLRATCRAYRHITQTQILFAVHLNVIYCTSAWQLAF